MSKLPSSEGTAASHNSYFSPDAPFLSNTLSMFHNDPSEAHMYMYRDHMLDMLYTDTNKDSGNLIMPAFGMNRITPGYEKNKNPFKGLSGFNSGDYVSRKDPLVHDNKNQWKPPNTSKPNTAPAPSQEAAQEKRVNAPQYQTKEKCIESSKQSFYCIMEASNTHDSVRLSSKANEEGTVQNPIESIEKQISKCNKTSILQTSSSPLIKTNFPATRPKVASASFNGSHVLRPELPYYGKLPIPRIKDSENYYAKPNLLLPLRPSQTLPKPKPREDLDHNPYYTFLPEFTSTKSDHKPRLTLTNEMTSRSFPLPNVHVCQNKTSLEQTACAQSDQKQIDDTNYLHKVCLPSIRNCITFFQQNSMNTDQGSSRVETSPYMAILQAWRQRRETLRGSRKSPEDLNPPEVPPKENTYSKDSAIHHSGSPLPFFDIISKFSSQIVAASIEARQREEEKNELVSLLLDYESNDKVVSRGSDDSTPDSAKDENSQGSHAITSASHRLSYFDRKEYESMDESPDSSNADTISSIKVKIDEEVQVNIPIVPEESPRKSDVKSKSLEFPHDTIHPPLLDNIVEDRSEMRSQIDEKNNQLLTRKESSTEYIDCPECIDERKEIEGEKVDRDRLSREASAGSRGRTASAKAQGTPFGSRIDEDYCGTERKRSHTLHNVNVDIPVAQEYNDDANSQFFMASSDNPLQHTTTPPIQFRTTAMPLAQSTPLLPPHTAEKVSIKPGSPKIHIKDQVPKYPEHYKNVNNFRTNRSQSVDSPARQIDNEVSSEDCKVCPVDDPMMGKKSGSAMHDKANEKGSFESCPVVLITWKDTGAEESKSTTSNSSVKRSYNLFCWNRSPNESKESFSLLIKRIVSSMSSSGFEISPSNSNISFRGPSLQTITSADIAKYLTHDEAKTRPVTSSSESEQSSSSQRPKGKSTDSVESYVREEMRKFSQDSLHSGKFSSKRNLSYSPINDTEKLLWKESTRFVEPLPSLGSHLKQDALSESQKVAREDEMNAYPYSKPPAAFCKKEISSEKSHARGSAQFMDDKCQGFFDQASSSSSEWNTCIKCPSFPSNKAVYSWWNRHRTNIGVSSKLFDSIGMFNLDTPDESSSEEDLNVISWND